MRARKRSLVSLEVFSTCMLETSGQKQRMRKHALSGILWNMILNTRGRRKEGVGLAQLEVEVNRDRRD